MISQVLFPSKKPISNKLGVAILFNNNFSFKILRQLSDKEGRYIIVDLEVGELTLTICNIYFPNTDDPEVSLKQ